MLRRLYAWILALSDRPSAPYALGAVAFAESSFFPVPPDVMLVPMAVARPDRVWFYAAITTVASVLGGLVGYAIGALLFDSVGEWLIRLYGLQNSAATFQDSWWLQHHGRSQVSRDQVGSRLWSPGRLFVAGPHNGAPQSSRLRGRGKGVPR